MLLTCRPWMFLLVCSVTALSAGRHAVLAAAPDPASQPAVADTTGRQVFDDLAALYAQNKPLRLDESIANLSAPEAPKRQVAGAYLAALLAQLKADETNGRTYWKRLPYWGGGSENLARETRKRLARSLGKAATGMEALAAARWLIYEDRLPESPPAGLAILRRTNTPESKAELLKLVRRPHPFPALTVGALEETGKQGWKEGQADVVALCTHHLTAVREAARACARQLGVEKLPAFVPEEAIGPELEGLLRDVAAMVHPPVPADAKFQRFEITRARRGLFVGTGTATSQTRPPEYTRTTRGWLLQETADTCVVLDEFGVQTILLKKDKLKALPGSLAEEATRITAIRAGKAANHDEAFSRRGALTGQFESGALSTPEALVAAWSLARGDRKTAAAVLFPCLDKLPDQRWAREIVRDLLGHTYHQEMLEQFSYYRNYSQALALAQHLSQPLFDGYDYQDRAKAFAAQLPQRADDFVTFVLPTDAEWAKLRSTLTRPEQIKYLAARLRLLNCIQRMQPGGVDMEDAQWREPEYPDRGRQRSECINPYVALQRMRITVAELPMLVPFLEDENLLPTFSYWRNFHPERTVYRVNEIVAGIIDHTAKRDLAELGKFGEMNAAARQAHLAKMLAWCKANAGKTEEDLLLERLRQPGNDARDVLWLGGQLARLKSRQATALLTAQMSKIDSASHSDLAEICYRLDDPAACPAARQWRTSTDQGVTFWAALILLRHGQKARHEGFAELRAVLASPEAETYYPLALDALLALDTEAARRLAEGALQTRQFKVDPEHSAVLKRLFLRGRQAALDRMIAAIQAQDLTTAQEALALVERWHKDKWTFDAAAAPEAQRKQGQEAIAWLKAQFAAIRAQKPPAMDTTLEPIARPAWILDAP